MGFPGASGPPVGQELAVYCLTAFGRNGPKSWHSLEPRPLAVFDQMLPLRPVPAPVSVIPAKRIRTLPQTIRIL
jgi:hypothetical protein